MIKINVITKNNNWLNYIKRPDYYLEKKIRKINFGDDKLKKKIIICTILLSGNKEIKHLNNKFRKKNKITDVLSFPFHSERELKKKLKTDKKIYIGDMIINLNEIKEKKVQKNFKKEFNRLWIHGLVHLLGYDHKKENDFKKMNKLEKKYFELVND
tara:strand:- start:720 stop:1187 length:468 start_codon:yes stop_codon:yes gene_type:complete